MPLRAFAETDYGCLPLGACFTDHNFDGRGPVHGRPGSLDYFTATFVRTGLFIKIHPEFAYRDGRTGLEEAVIRYEPSAQVIYANDAGFNGVKAVDGLMMDLLGKIMEHDPAGTSTRLLLEA